MTIEIEENATTGIDTTLMAAAKAARWEFLLRIEPYRPRLYAFCRRLTANPFDAEDLVQDVLAKAFVRAAQSHTPVDDPLPWLLRVAGNAFIDQRRRHMPEPVDPASLAEQPAGPHQRLPLLTGAGQPRPSSVPPLTCRIWPVVQPAPPLSR